MNPYMPNPTCQCPRCRARGLMGAAILITLGVLILLHNLYVVRLGESFPALFIVIGLMLYLGHSASIAGHVQPVTPAGAVPPPPPIPSDQHGPEVNQ
jgi:hypothetical protein